MHKLHEKLNIRTSIFAIGRDDLAFNSPQFDFIVFTAVLGSIPTRDFEKVFRTLGSLLSPGGYLLVSGMRYRFGVSGDVVYGKSLGKSIPLVGFRSLVVQAFSALALWFGVYKREQVIFKSLEGTDLNSRIEVYPTQKHFFDLFSKNELDVVCTAPDAWVFWLYEPFTFKKIFYPEFTESAFLAVLQKSTCKSSE